VVEGTAPPPPLETPTQIGGIPVAGLATHKRGEWSSWCEPCRMQMQ
jgi:hypothetical protein